MIYIIYKTTNLINNKTYIGIHQTKNLEDGYLGSGLALLRSVKKYGKQNFKREILEYCSSYEELLEKEKSYVDENWVKERNNYNMKTGGQSAGILSEESKNKISNTLKEKYSNGELIPNYTAPFIMTDEIKEKISNTLKEKYSEIEHFNLGRKGWKGKTIVPPWNKGLKGVQVSWCKGLKLKPKTDEEKLIQSEKLKEYYKTHDAPAKGKEAWNKGLASPKIECPNCQKLVDAANGKRWHFDNCKLK